MNKTPKDRKNVKILFLTRYDTLGASSRLRALQYIPSLEKVDMQCTVIPYFTNKQLQIRYKQKNYSYFILFKSLFKRIYILLKLRNFDIIWIEKESLPWTPAWLEKWLLRDAPYILDYDDAIFHKYDQHPLLMVRYFFGKRIDKLMTNSSLLIAGNHYLAQRAKRARAKRITIIPTAINLDRYPFRKTPVSSKKKLRIVWIGSPSTAQYLKIIEKPLHALTNQYDFILRIIGAKEINLLNTEIEYVDWTEETEVSSLMECDIGIMPLRDTPWEQGKCGYKLIQYMACGLPVVASKVGANNDIVDVGINGFLATNDEEWQYSLGTLLENNNLRDEMGHEGRKLVENKYCIQQTSHLLIDAINKISFDIANVKPPSA